MDSHFWLNVVVRWIHITAAVVGVGGAAFLLWVLLPAARAVGPDAARPVLEIVHRRYRWLVRSVMALLLLTGAYNLVLVIPRARALGTFKPVYHSVLGTKILLALALFGIAEALLSSSGGVARLTTGRARGLAAVVGLALLILLLSACLRRLWDLDIRLRIPVARTTCVPRELQMQKIGCPSDLCGTTEEERCLKNPRPSRSTCAFICAQRRCIIKRGLTART